MSDCYLVFVGTRPECIKMLPIVLSARERGLNYKLCDTTQHKDLNRPIFDFFGLEPDYVLNLDRVDGGLVELSSILLKEADRIIRYIKPIGVILHGDTTTSFIASLAAFLNKVKIIHVEAGLRTFNKFSPFPEEMNRRLTGTLADIHFAPTNEAKNNLLKEGVSENQIFVVGNTAMDALKYAEQSATVKAEYAGSTVVLVTIHRRENHGDNLLLICSELIKLAESFSELKIIIPLHPNPNVGKVMEGILGTISNIILITSLPYGDFVALMLQSSIIITDSGGIQEEVTYLGIPTLVVRDYTERPEAIAEGPCILIEKIESNLSDEVSRLLRDPGYYAKRSRSSNIFGDGRSSEKIISNLLNF